MAFAKKLLICMMSLVSATVSSTAGAQGYPAKPIVLVVPFAPGGFVHTVALMYGESVGNILGQSVVILNKPGANGNIAAEFVAKSAPDGYTLFLPTASILTINPHLYKNIPFDALKDFAPVGLIANTSNMFVVSPRSGVKTLKDLVDKARANPGTVSYGSSGTGSIQNIAGESLQHGSTSSRTFQQSPSPPLQPAFPATLHLRSGTASSLRTGQRRTSSPRSTRQWPRL